MGTIKDVIDLVTQLYDSVKDKKTREALLPIREKLAGLREDFVDQKAAHAAQVEEIKKSHSQEIQALQRKLRNCNRRTLTSDRSSKTMKTRHLYWGNMSSTSGQRSAETRRRKLSVHIVSIRTRLQRCRWESRTMNGSAASAAPSIGIQIMFTQVRQGL